NGDNLQVVWYVRGDPWTSQTWTTSDPWEAINYIKAQLGIPDEEDERWEMGTPSSEDQAQAQDYANGFLASDPLGPAVWSMPDPEAWIQDLVLLGYPAANLSADNAAGCSSSEVLDGLAAEFEDMIGDGDETVLDLRTSGVSCDTMASTFPRGPPPTKPLPKPAPGPTVPGWSPPGTVPTVPGGWIPGGWPTLPAPAPPGTPAWGCRTVTIGGGGKNCICSREQRWGRSE